MEVKADFRPHHTNALTRNFSYNLYLNYLLWLSPLENDLLPKYSLSYRFQFFERRVMFSSPDIWYFSFLINFCT